ncbi:hypothetical protein BD626DRAFT_385447, partial [Schizophyllum amplum]
ILRCITHFLQVHDALSLSSACTSLRAVLSPNLLASCRWRKGKRPPRSVRHFIRHLFIDTDEVMYTDSKFFRDLSGLQSIHIYGQAVTASMAGMLVAASNIDELDLSYLCYRPEDSKYPLHYDLQPGFSSLSCRPKMLKFCSRLGRQYTRGGEDMLESRIRALRYPLVTLLHQVDVAQIEVFEVCAEALPLPIATAYSWSSLRELIITGFWLHACDDPGVLDDPDIGTPAWAYDCVHLGTLLLLAPRLRVLRVSCGYAEWLSHPRCVVWPRAEPPPPSGSAVPLLQELQLCNPIASDGIFSQLPPSVRVLSLLILPHLTQETDANTQEELEIMEARDAHETLVPSALINILAAAPLPDLRELRFSFRNLDDMHIFEFIAARFPRLELLEFHAEIGPGCLWSADELAECARALSTLRHLRVLRVNTFYEVLLRDNRDSEEYWEAVVRHRSGIPRESIVAALFGPLASVREVWMP